MYCVRCVYLSFFDLQGLISTCPRSETKRGPCTYESGVVGYWRAALRPMALPSSPREFPNHSSSNYCQRIGSIFVSVSNSSRPYLLCVLIPGCQFVLNVCTYTCILNSSPPPTHTHYAHTHTTQYPTPTEPLMDQVLNRIPLMEKAEIRQQINGPESFTPDMHAIMGEAPEVIELHYWTKKVIICCTFNKVWFKSFV